jgi:uncharacterized protein
MCNHAILRHGAVCFVTPCITDRAKLRMQSLLDGLNSVAGAGTYAFVNVPGRNGDGVVGTDVISVKLIYKPATFEPV